MSLLDIDHANFLIGNPGDPKCSLEGKVPCNPKTDVQFCGGNSVEQLSYYSGIFSSSSGNRVSGAPVYNKVYKIRGSNIRIRWDGSNYWQMQHDDLGTLAYTKTSKNELLNPNNVWYVYDSGIHDYVNARDITLTKAECYPRECCQLRDDAINPNFNCMRKRNGNIVQSRRACMEATRQRRKNCIWQNHPQCKEPGDLCKLGGSPCEKDEDCCNGGCSTRNGCA